MAWSYCNKAVCKRASAAAILACMRPLVKIGTLMPKDNKLLQPVKWLSLFTSMRPLPPKKLMVNRGNKSAFALANCAARACTCMAKARTSGRRSNMPCGVCPLGAAGKRANTSVELRGKIKPCGTCPVSTAICRT